MATRKLKVYRTAIGFHDAYVAAPSQKAALEAWGSDHNLFATGQAELVSDESLMREPLDHPGKVIKLRRGSADDHLSALSMGRRKQGKGPKRTAPRPPGPRPGRAALDEAEAALTTAERDRDDALARIDAERAVLDRRRRETEGEHGRAIERLTRERDRRREHYAEAMAKWREEE